MRALLLLAMAVLLTGCATGEAAAPTATVSPSPTAACPEPPGTEPRAGCAPYDPDAAMAENDRYRQRIPLGEEAAAAAAEHLPAVRRGLESLRTGGTALTAAAVTEVLQDAGLASVQTRAAAGDVLFGATAPDGGCVFGAVTPEAVTAEIGGGIMDGGCLPAQ
ncbi:hypothetical protein [Microbacterium sp. JZ31]|uniref:hypothetical protein n=1 Tax=Microbacterium sp. JZ31 TaxID=1906274 RepID=UPI001931EFD4|nr:hypothetical protein [Microbacterium sp. JZ31]